MKGAFWSSLQTFLIHQNLKMMSKAGSNMAWYLLRPRHLWSDSRLILLKSAKLFLINFSKQNSEMALEKISKISKLLIETCSLFLRVDFENSKDEDFNVGLDSQFMYNTKLDSSFVSVKVVKPIFLVFFLSYTVVI